MASLIPAGGTTAAVVVADSVFSNIVYTFYSSQQLSFNYTTQFQNTSVLFDLSVTQPPHVNFTADPAPNATKIILEGEILAFSADGQTELFTSWYQLTMDVDIKLTAQQTLVAQV